jgi:ribosome-binding factor A
MGDGSGARSLRLQELIREEVNLLLRSEIRDRRLDGVNITMVELVGDCARLWFSADGEHDEKLEALAGAAGFIRSRLADALGGKRTPELRFRKDPAKEIW